MAAMRTWSQRVLGGLAALLLAAVVSAQSNVSPRFMRLTADDGLTQSTILAMAQDPDGFVWLATQDGLNRYDGHRVRHFKRRREGGGPRDNFLTSLAMDHAGHLWMGTRIGAVSRFDLRQERFEHLMVTPEVAEISSLQVDAQGVLWIASLGQGLFRVEPDTFEAQAYEWQGDGPGPRIHDLSLARDGGIWVAGEQAVAHIGSDGHTQVLHTGVHALTVVESEDGTVWIGTAADGLMRLDSDGEVLEHWRQGVEGLPGARINDLLVDKTGAIWIATETGLARRQPSARRFEVFRHNPADAGSISANRVISLMQDRSGVVWVGSWTGGANRASPYQGQFLVVRYGPADEGGLPGSYVRAVYEDQRGTLWLSILDEVGLVRRMRDQPHFEPFPSPDQSPNLQGAFIESIAPAGADALWLGMRGQGVQLLDTQSGELRAIAADPDQQPNLAGRSAYSLNYEADQGVLWIGLREGGLYRYHAEQGLKKVDNAGLGPVQAIRRRSDGRLWIGTQLGGLCRVDEGPGAELRADCVLVEDGRDGQGLAHDSITSLLEDTGGRFWIGTQGGGLMRMLDDGGADLSSARFALISTEQGLAADAIGGILEDQRGAIWISTTVGLSRIEPESGRVSNFGGSDGVQSAGFFIGSWAAAGNGELLFGGLDGLTRVLPRTRNVDPVAPRPQLVGLSLNQRPLSVGAGADAGLSESPSFLRELTLPPGENSLTLEFAALHFGNPNRNRYAYRLLGFTDDWIEVDADRPFASYPRLPVGRYVFELRAANPDGVWSQQPMRLTVTQPSPWWASAAAMVVYGTLLTMLLFWGGRAWRARRQRELQIQDQVRVSEERLKMALWGSGDELFIMDLVHQRLFRENRLPNLLSNIEVSSDRMDDYVPYVHPEDLPEFQKALVEHIKGLSPTFEVQYRSPTADGSWAWLLTRGRVVERSPEGRALRMTGTNRDINALISAQQELRRLNEELEGRVASRTQALSQANDELEEMLNQVQSMQNQLIQSEKMASLGSLVAGVSHEINTPVGVGVTAASHLAEATVRLREQLGSGALSKSLLDNYLAQASESSQLILRNLKRASDLVKSFKQVAVDQSSEARRRFALAEYLDEILLSLRPELKRTKHRIEMDVPRDLELESYPGALTQVIVNLVMNSLVHAFPDIEEGTMTIRAHRAGDTIAMSYADNGVGLSEDVRQRIFDPFFTTRRGSGGSGLGMHIVYNLVTTVMGGRIQAHGSPGKGIEVLLWLPVMAPATPSPRI